MKVPRAGWVGWASASTRSRIYRLIPFQRGGAVFGPSGIMCIDSNECRAINDSSASATQGGQHHSRAGGHVTCLFCAGHLTHTGPWLSRYPNLGLRRSRRRSPSRPKRKDKK